MAFAASKQYNFAYIAVLAMLKDLKINEGLSLKTNILSTSSSQA